MVVKKILEILGIILFCVLIPYLIASLLEWGFIVKEWGIPTKIVLSLIYIFIVPYSTICYLINDELKESK